MEVLDVFVIPWSPSVSGFWNYLWVLKTMVLLYELLFFENLVGLYAVRAFFSVVKRFGLIIGVTFIFVRDSPILTILSLTLGWGLENLLQVEWARVKCPRVKHLELATNNLILYQL